MSPLAHSSHRAQQAGLHAYICDVLSPSVHLLYSPACMHACMHAYIRHTCTALVHAFLLHVYLSRAREIYHARLFSIPSILDSCRVSLRMLLIFFIHVIQSDQDPCSAEIMPPWLHFAFAYTVQYGWMSCVTFPSRLCQGKLSVCVHDAHVQVYPVFHGWVLFFLFFCYTFAGLSCTRTASLPGCAKPKVIVCANGISLETKKNNNSQQSQCNSEKHKVQPKKTST